MKLKLQPIIIVLAIISLYLAIGQMLQTRTMILPSWFLVLFYSVIVFCISFVLGFLTKKMLSSRWHVLTFAAVFVLIICSIFYISQYKPTCEIYVPDNYTGEVKLFVSNEEKNDFVVNKYGIGYINKSTFDNGFYPRIFRGKVDITKQITQYAKGALATTAEKGYSCEFLSFSIHLRKIEDSDIENLIRIKAIDTNRLYRK